MSNLPEPILPPLLYDYQQQRPALFPSRGSIDWWLRNPAHRKAVIDGGALLLIRGRWHVVPDRFDAAVMAQGQIDAANSTAKVEPSTAGLQARAGVNDDGAH